jgi:hypothetical protein
MTRFRESFGSFIALRMLVSTKAPSGSLAAYSENRSRSSFHFPEGTRSNLAKRIESVRK